MTRPKDRRSLPLLALLASFGAGVLVDGWLRTYGPPKPAQALPVMSAAPVSQKQPSDASHPAPAVWTTRDVPTGHLRMPIDGTDMEALKGGFDQRRGGDRPHEAVDLLSPRNTPVHAVENGTIAKLFYSKAGGLTIYQFDPSARLCYYYAHLERYADGLREGGTIAQGDVIGYVGTSGNAPAHTPHLHFAVFELDGDRRWWQGRALDPYRVFKEKGIRE